MKDIRELVQQKLEEIQNLETTSSIPDDLMELGKVYFTYTLQKFFIDKDYDKNYTYKIVISGFIKTKDSSDVDILEKVDEACDSILDKLKELNFECQLVDVTTTDSSVRKIRLTGSVKYNEINNILV